MSIARRVVVALFPFILLTVAIGCNNKGRIEARDINVTLDEGMRDAQGRMPAVQVDIFAASPADLPRWNSHPVNDYWDPRDALRATGDKKTLAFAPTDKSKSMSKSDPLWTQWINKQGDQAEAG